MNALVFVVADKNDAVPPVAQGRGIGVVVDDLVDHIGGLFDRAYRQPANGDVEVVVGVQDPLVVVEQTEVVVRREREDRVHRIARLVGRDEIIVLPVEVPVVVRTIAKQKQKAEAIAAFVEHLAEIANGGSVLPAARKLVEQAVDAHQGDLHVVVLRAMVGQALRFRFEIFVIENDHIHLVDAVQVLIGRRADRFGLQGRAVLPKGDEGLQLIGHDAEIKGRAVQGAVLPLGMQRIGNVPNGNIVAGIGQLKGSAGLGQGLDVAEDQLLAGHAQLAAGVDLYVVEPAFARSARYRGVVDRYGQIVVGGRGRSVELPEGGEGTVRIAQVEAFEGVAVERLAVDHDVEAGRRLVGAGGELGFDDNRTVLHQVRERKGARIGIRALVLEVIAEPHHARTLTELVFVEEVHAIVFQPVKIVEGRSRIGRIDRGLIGYPQAVLATDLQKVITAGVVDIRLKIEYLCVAVVDPLAGSLTVEQEVVARVETPVVFAGHQDVILFEVVDAGSGCEFR